MLSQDSLFYWKGPQTTLLVERTRGHHVVPRCKGGTETVPTCHSCEDFIHKTWSHKELRDTFNTVEKIQADPLFQKFQRPKFKGIRLCGLDRSGASASEIEIWSLFGVWNLVLGAYFRPCGVAQKTCLPLVQEITGAKPVRDASFTALKAFSAMRSLGKRA